MTNDSYDTMSIICRCEALPGTGRVEQFGKHVTDVYRVFYVRLSVYILTIVKEKIIIIIIIRGLQRLVVHAVSAKHVADDVQ